MTAKERYLETDVKDMLTMTGDQIIGDWQEEW